MYKRQVIYIFPNESDATPLNVLKLNRMADVVVGAYLTYAMPSFVPTRVSEPATIWYIGEEAGDGIYLITWLLVVRYNLLELNSSEFKPKEYVATFTDVIVGEVGTVEMSKLNDSLYRLRGFVVSIWYITLLVTSIVIDPLLGRTGILTMLAEVGVGGEPDMVICIWYR